MYFSAGDTACAWEAEMSQQVPAPQEGTQPINNQHLLSAYFTPSTELRAPHALILFDPLVSVVMPSGWLGG